MEENTRRHILNDAEKQEAVNRVKSLCDQKMKGYQLLSMRSGLRELGYSFDQCDDVIQYVADRGFNYCLDPMIACKGITMKEAEHPIMDVCYWGPDQLKSRLEFIRG